MGIIYKENKNFVNKFIALLNSGIKRNFLIDEDVSATFFGGIRTRVNFDMKMSDVFIEETGKNLYFCTKLKEVNRTILSSNYNNDETEIGITVFRSLFRRYNPPIDLVGELRLYLDRKFQKDLKGNTYKEMDNSTLSSAVRSSDEIPNSQLKDFPKAKEIIEYMKRLKTADVDIYLHPDVFKSLKNREAFPLAYINDDKDKIYYPFTYTSSRKSMASFTNAPLSESDGIQLKNLSRYAVSYAPLSKWAVIDIKSQDLDKKEYMSYNFDI